MSFQQYRALLETNPVTGVLLWKRTTQIAVDSMNKTEIESYNELYIRQHNTRALVVAIERRQQLNNVTC